jgi:erythromycin esterase
VSALAGCAVSDDAEPETGNPPSASPDETPPRTDETASLTEVIEQEAVAFELRSSSEQLDTVAAELAQSSIVGIGENSHGIAAFKKIPSLLVQRLVSDHGYRLVAIEGTLGDFSQVNQYIHGDSDDLDAAIASLEFYFWRTDAIEQMFEWLREFNTDRPSADRVEVRGYDAQFHDINAAAIRSYLERVDPEYVAEISDSLDPLTKPLYEQSDASFMTESQVTLIEELRTRFQQRKSEYVSQSSESEWRLAKRHLWTLERGLQFLEASSAKNYTRGKRIRDAAMAENVSWLRDWTDSDRVVVMGNSNHTMRGGGGQHAARMGTHLTDKFGAEYYSLGLLFGSGEFSAPAHQHGEFTTYEIGSTVDDTLESTLVDVSQSPIFLDFDSAREHSQLSEWLETTSKTQFTVPRAADRGAVGLSEPPGELFDGIVFVREATPATFMSQS